MKFDPPIVLLLGAGATRGALKDNSVPPPVDADFFEIAGQIKGHGTAHLASSVLKDVWSLYGRVSGIGLEDYYRDIETREKIGSFAKSANKPKDWPKRRKHLEELIRRVVVHTTCEPEDYRLKPLKSLAHKQILKILSKGDTVITFNYDMLIEESFEDASVWTPQGGYGDKVHGVRSEWCKRWFKERNIEKTKSSKIRILKLHGSVNWTLYKTAEIKLKDRPFVVRTHDKSIVYDKVSILPPGWNKRIDVNPYKNLWKDARLKLERCKTLMIVGYSLPETDLLAKALFAEVVRLRSARAGFLKELHLADPNEVVKQKFVDLFGRALGPNSKIYKYRNIEELQSRLEKR